MWTVAWLFPLATPPNISINCRHRVPNAEHAFVVDYDCPTCNTCGQLKSPFINNCQFDMAGALLQHLLGPNLVKKAVPVDAHLQPLDQTQFFPAGTTQAHMGMGPTAYVYTPARCRASNGDDDGVASSMQQHKAGEAGGDATGCKIHVVYHGCNSSVQAPGKMSIVKYAGYNGWAEANNIIILYPQTLESACWDWTGATIPGNPSTAYDTRTGIQSTAVNRMVDWIAAKQRSTAKVANGNVTPPPPISVHTAFMHSNGTSSNAAATHAGTSTTTAKSSRQVNKTAAADSLVDMDLFVAGVGGYSCYRLPNLVMLRKQGHMLAIVQGHRFDCSDGGAMDVLARRTTDGGKTWTPAALVYTETTPSLNVTIGAPSAVADLRLADDGGGGGGGGAGSSDVQIVYLFLTRNNKELLLLASRDGGASWGKPRDMTQQLVPKEWNGIYPGLPQGMQLAGSGRLIVCANHVTDDSAHSHTIYSDDGGSTWQNGASVEPDHMGECSLAQTSAGVWMYARVWWDDSSSNKTHALALSTDNGATFTKGNTSAFPGGGVRESGGGNDNICDSQGAIIATRDTFLVGAPFGRQHFPRQNYTVLASHVNNANGKPSAEWHGLDGASPLWKGQAGYSTMAVRDASTPRTDRRQGVPPDTFFVIYERGVHSSNEVLRLTELALP